MPHQMTDEEIRKMARERVNEKKGFFIHLVVIWTVTGRGFPWFLFPLGGWGIGVIFHFLGVFVFSQHGTSNWENRQMEKEIERIKKSQNM